MHRRLAWAWIAVVSTWFATAACSGSDDGGGTGGTAGSAGAGVGGQSGGETDSGGTGGSAMDAGDCQTTGCPDTQTCQECLGPDGTLFVCLNPDEICARL